MSRALAISLILSALLGGIVIGAFIHMPPQQALVGVATRTVVIDDAKTVVGINDYRATKGLPALQTSEQLHSSACAKVADMIAKNYWDHNDPEGREPWHFIIDTGYTYKNAGENQAYGFLNESGIVNGWINSPEHEKVMSGEYTSVGVCSKQGNFQGGYNWVTVAHFATEAN